MQILGLSCYFCAMIPAAIITKYRQNKLGGILLAALIIRLMSAIFSTGYGMHDDHFITIEVAQSWIDGENRDGWLPDKDKGYVSPSGHSLTYPALLCGMLYSCEAFGITDPNLKMLIIRLLHALLSLLWVWLGYMIVRRLYNERTAVIAGWGLALFWMFPMLGVRNLVEMACITPLMASIWLMVRDGKRPGWELFWSGICAGLAFSIRFQTGFFIAGSGLFLMARGRLTDLMRFSIGTLITICITQGITDISVWGYPFAELRGYAEYNLAHSGDYPNGPWYNYSLLLIGILIPPVSFLLLAGFIREWKRALVLFLPVLLFFLFHSYFPNKQERFILPIVPFVLMSGIAGYVSLKDKGKGVFAYAGLIRGLVWFALVLNMFLLLLLSFSSSKKNRVDAMYYLSRYRNISCYAVENSNHENGIVMPKFYLNKQWPVQFNICSDTPIDELKTALDSGELCRPQFILFMEEEHLQERVDRMKSVFPGLVKETVINPSFIDQLMHWLNPVNINQVTVIYRTGY